MVARQKGEGEEMVRENLRFFPLVSRGAAGEKGNAE